MTNLAVFCLGTILGMGFVTTMIAMPIVWAASRRDCRQHVLAAGKALLSFGFGVVLAWHIAISDQLFASGPIGMPQ